MPNLLTRDDTLLGVCQGIGDDVGFNANYVRVALAAVLLASPVLAIGVYLALGIVVLIARLGWPATTAPVAAGEPAPVAHNDDAAPLARAA